MKIAIITHKTKNLARTRKKLLESFLDKNYEVIAICPESDYIDELEKIGVRAIVTNSNRISINLFNILKYFFNIIKILRKEKPDILFNYTIKPNIIGSIAGKLADVQRIYSMITGMGYIYSSEKLRVKFIRIFCNIGYRLSFKCNTRVIFQNKDDRDEFVEKKYIDDRKAFVIDGSGVNLEQFKFTKLPNEFNFLMIARTLDVKGVEEFFKAAKIIKKRHPEVTFSYVGEIERNYRGVNPKIIEEYNEKNIVKFEGHKENIIPYLEKCKVFVLPSYLREGIPRTLLEALAVGRPVITTNVRGCKETIKVGKNGILVKPRDVKDLVEKMEYMIENKDELEAMGQASYEYAKERFDINIINQKMLELMEL